MAKIKRGYKQTDIGVIPEDWECVEIANYIDFLTGFPFPSNGYTNDGIRLVRGSNIKRGKTDWSEEITQYWKELSPELGPYILKEGDIVIAMDGSLVGRSFAQISTKDLPSLLLQRVARIRSGKIKLSFLKEAICNEYFTLYCDKVKTTSAIPHISPLDIKNYTIALPPTKKEQEAIATALSDIDSLIDELTKLIDKKRAIKEGAMQQLLSPQKGWKMESLGHLCELIVDGTHQTPIYVNNGIPFYSVENITNNNFSKTKYISLNEHLLLIKRCKIAKGDILLTRIGSVGKTKLIDWDVNASIYVSLALLRVNEQKINKLFLYSYTKSSLFIKDVEALSLMNAIPLKINMDNIKKIPINYPPSFEEQQQIASTLSDMDNEIEILKQNLSKYKAIKTGMMQQLLTGQIRLI